MIPIAKSTLFPRRVRQLMFVLSTVVLLAGGATADAQDAFADGRTIKVRMLLADNSDSPSSNDLADILPLLRQNLRYKSYRVVARKLTPPRSSVFDLAFGYKLQYANVDLPSLTVSISRNAQTLLRTRLHLRPSRPVIVGGFQHGRDSTVIMVLELRADKR